MARFVYNGAGLVAPTLGLTLADGDVFEAPDDFVASGVSSSRAKVTVSSDADPVVADVLADAPAEAPVETPTSDAAAPVADTAPAETN